MAVQAAAAALPKTKDSDLASLQAFEALKADNFGPSGWQVKLEPVMLNELGGHRKYNFNSFRELLRAVRNKVSSPFSIVFLIVIICDNNAKGKMW